MIKFLNTISQKKEEFNSGQNKPVSLYVCGITPYDFAHIGHGRCYVFFDFLYRFLQFSGYCVSYCRNFTDIDDKIINRAKKELGDVKRYAEISEKYITAFAQDMKSLNCKVPDHEPRVTDTIPEIVAFIQGLIEKDAAYERDGSVYFRVKSFSEYGKLSKQNIAALESGARVEVDSCKEDPLDFALWKRDDTVGFESPWGQGRPGWHIECSAMSRLVFNDSLTIHGGGMDLIFPHHENEIAQSESLYPAPYSHFWIHNAFVQINQEKMSKSLGNFFTLHEVFKQFDPMVIRFYFLKHHYRGPLEFSIDDIAGAEKAYKKLTHAFEDVCIKSVKNIELVKEELVVDKMMQCLEDDLNTSGAFGVLFEKLPLLKDDQQGKTLVKWFLVNVFGLTLELLPEKTIQMTDEIKTLLEKRDQARAEKNWKQADELRDQLQKLGYNPQDKKLK